MNEKKLSQIQLIFTCAVTLIVWSTLLWQHLHDGVPSHYLLHRDDFPAISNWWGGLLLPVISWFLTGRLKKRILSDNERDQKKLFKSALLGFTGAVLYGATLSILFLTGQSGPVSMVFKAVFIIAFFIRIYREAYVLGFILSMSFTFGAVLPTLFAVIISVIGAILYNLPRLAWKYIKHRGNAPS